MGKSQFNGEEKFNDGETYQISKVSSFQKVTGSKTRNIEDKGNNTAYFITRVKQDGVLPTGEVYYKREVVMFDSKAKWKAYNELDPGIKGDGANGLGVTVATGSTIDGQKTFELTEKGANISFVKNNEEKLKRYSSNGVKDIAVGENPLVKKGLRDFSNNQFANSKDDALDSKPSEKKAKSLDSKLARGNIGKSTYPTMFYPSHIQDSEQDKLKITILKPRDVNSSSKFRKKFVARKSGNTNMGDGSGILIPNDYKNFPEGHELERFNNMQGKYVGMIQRSDFQRNQNKIYAASDNLNQAEFDKTPIGHIFLPIPDGVSDQNKVNFGEGKLNPIEN